MKKMPPCVEPSVHFGRLELNAKNLAFLGALDRAIQFHHTNQNDPHNIGQAVVVALTEVRDCFKAYMI